MLDITETRVDTLEQLLLGHLNDERLNVGAVGKLSGWLSATISQSHGKWGRAKLGPIKARQNDHHNTPLFSLFTFNNAPIPSKKPAGSVTL